MQILRLLNSRHPAPGKVCKRRGPATLLYPVQLFPLDCDVSEAHLRGLAEKFFILKVNAAFLANQLAKLPSSL